MELNRNGILHAARTLLVVVLLLGLAACGGIQKPFNPLDEHKTYRPSSIAIISGSHREGDVHLAQFVTDGLTKRSTFRVMPQEEIQRRLPDYPSIIDLRDDVKDDDEKAIWFKASEKNRLNAIQAKLKVDYLFVIWNSEMVMITGDNGTTYYVYPVGNMIEYPGGKVVASTRSHNGSSTSILALFRSRDYYIVDALHGAADDIVDEFLDVTKSKKP